MMKKNYPIFMIGAICILIIITPIMVLNISYLKSYTLIIFKTKENSYQYLQFIGDFLGMTISLLGAFITINYQINKEKKVQFQIKLRDELCKKINIVKKDLSLLMGELYSVKWAAEESLKGNDGFKEVYNDEFRINVKDNYTKSEMVYQNDIADFKIELESIEEQLDFFLYKFINLRSKIERVDNSVLNIGMTISIFPSYNSQMMKSLLEKASESEGYCNDLYEELSFIIKSLNKYFGNK